MNVTEPRPPTRGLGPLWSALALGAALLFWIANGAALFEGDRTDAWHHYQYLVDGFLGGHTSLSVQPSPELLKLRCGMRASTGENSTSILARRLSS
jgi:hypothetical protein